MLTKWTRKSFKLHAAWAWQSALWKLFFQSDYKLFVSWKRFNFCSFASHHIASDCIALEISRNKKAFDYHESWVIFDILTVDIYFHQLLCSELWNTSYRTLTLNFRYILFFAVYFCCFYRHICWCISHHRRYNNYNLSTKALSILLWSRKISRPHWP